MSEKKVKEDFFPIKLHRGKIHPILQAYNDPSTRLIKKENLKTLDIFDKILFS